MCIMSVVIKMDMPENCKRCGLYCIGGYSYSNAYCGKTKTLILDDKKRNDDCPILCELPAKHGG